MEVEAIAHAQPWMASRSDRQAIYVTILTDSMNLLQKKKEKENVELEAQTGMSVSVVDWVSKLVSTITVISGWYPPWKTLVGVLLWTCWNQG